MCKEVADQPVFRFMDVSGYVCGSCLPEMFPFCGVPGGDLFRGHEKRCRTPGAGYGRRCHGFHPCRDVHPGHGVRERSPGRGRNDLPSLAGPSQSRICITVSPAVQCRLGWDHKACNRAKGRNPFITPGLPTRPVTKRPLPDTRFSHVPYPRIQINMKYRSFNTGISECP